MILSFSFGIGYNTEMPVSFPSLDCEWKLWGQKNLSYPPHETYRNHETALGEVLIIFLSFPLHFLLLRVRCLGHGWSKWLCQRGQRELGWDPDKAKDIRIILVILFLSRTEKFRDKFWFTPGSKGIQSECCVCRMLIVWS